METNTPLEILRIVQNAKSILLHFHPNPDQDSIGSSLALYHILKKMGKKVSVISGDSVPRPCFSALPGFDEVIIKNYFEIDIQSFDTFIIIDSSSKEFVSSKGEVIFPPHLKTIVIDHHKSNKYFGEINYVDTNAPAAAEVLYQVIAMWNIEISKEAATCLLVALHGDTVGFKYARAETFQIAASLAKISPDFRNTIADVDENRELGEIKLFSLGLQNIQTRSNGKIITSTVSRKEIEKNNITTEQTQLNPISATLKGIVGAEIVLSIIETTPESVRVSLRSKHGDLYDVSNIASTFGGGGHAESAGVLFKNTTIEEVEEKVLAKIFETYPELCITELPAKHPSIKA